MVVVGWKNENAAWFWAATFLFPSDALNWAKATFKGQTVCVWFDNDIWWDLESYVMKL